MIRRTSLPARSSVLPRSTKPIRRTWVKRSNPKRQKKAFARAYEDGERADWFKRQPCCVCGWYESVNAHTSGDGGMGLKSSARFMVPLCPPHWQGSRLVEGCHEESGRGVQTFQAKYDIDFATLAKYYESKWRAHSGGEAA